mgnify:CR=1 FL=1
MPLAGFPYADANWLSALLALALGAAGMTALGFVIGAVLVLHDVEGYTHQEIGDQLGISDGTSKSQLHGARKAMRRLLNAGLETA